MSDASLPAKRGRTVATMPAIAPLPTDGGELALIAAALIDPRVDADKLGKLMDLQERVMRREGEVAFNQAFARLQAKLPRVRKNGTLEYPVNKNDPDGPKKKIASFARWEDIDAAIRPVLQSEGFALTFRTAQRPGDGGGIVVTCVLIHSGGHATETSIPVPLDNSGGKNSLQGYGSSLSYGQRYSAKAALNIIFEGEDDDGVRGSKRFITEAQAATLATMLAELPEHRREQFFDYIGVQRVEDIDETDCIRAGTALHGAVKAAKALAAQQAEADQAKAAPVAEDAGK